MRLKKILEWVARNATTIVMIVFLLSSIITIYRIQVLQIRLLELTDCILEFVKNLVAATQ